ncbi:hypothetical protein [Nocardia sp. NPDC058666]|uniref:hypothetical protein n=1 Tax=unclassified Nocardia TaxID=2637762 RepID=UPI0036561A06
MTDEATRKFAEERQALLDEGNRLKRLYKDLGYTDEGEKAIYQAIELGKQYRELLPDVLVSRCPFTDEPVRWPMDTVDLDGWYWDSENPIRRVVDPVLPTWLAMGGAVRLVEPLTSAPFFRKPGPDRPYVIPRILERPTVRAVIAQIPIGPHTGWNTTYFSTQRAVGVPLENFWGAEKYDVYDAKGHWRAWNEHTQIASDYDFDLRPWIEAGKLLWIAPDDPTASLHQDTDGCPYLDIDGTHTFQRILHAKVEGY